MSYITGNQSSVKVKGPKKVINIYKKCLTESRKLYKLLNEVENVKLSEIEKQVQIKNQAAQEFKKITGDFWPF